MHEGALASAAATVRWWAGREQRFDPGMPRSTRPLAVGEPAVHAVTASDGVELRLTRYRGGDRGPVLLAHCIGVSSRMYSTDTVEPNLLEFLYARGFDVWLLDYRFSIDLPAARAQSTFDDVATKDYPAAIEAVRRLAGVDSVQVVAHGVGSSTLTMALLAGAQGVRSAVCSQVSTHLLVPPWNQLKTGLHSPSLLYALGMRTTTAYTDARATLIERLYDRSLRGYPIDREERCASPTCHRISVLYGELYQHDRLASSTHEALHELFGVVNLTALRQLAKITRAGYLVDAAGADRYLPHLDRLAIPITFLHGEENECVSPQSTQITYELLRRRLGDRYQRHVIPGYGHVDCMIGERAASDVFPLILDHLERTGAR